MGNEMSEGMMYKSRQVEKYLLKHGHISSWEAIQMFGATRLAAIIFNLRKVYNIETREVYIKDRNGRNCRYADYYMIGKL